ncbi:MAG: glycosyltransferase [Bacillota bacterium]
MKKNILIIAHFCSDFDGNGNNRFNYIADLLSLHGNDVELVTTDFSHSRKQRRSESINQSNFQVTMCHEPIYLKNVSLKRFYSHYVMGQNLKKYLETRKKPDVIYCAVPSLDAGKVAADYAKKNNVRFIIDVQDLWPEAFKMVFKVPFVSDILFHPLLKKADYIYRAADEIIAVSQTYTERALRVNNNAGKGHSIFLGTDLASFDKLAKENKIKDKPNG